MMVLLNKFWLDVSAYQTHVVLNDLKNTDEEPLI